MSHIVKSYDEDLKNLKAILRTMGDMAIQQIEKALGCIEHPDEKKSHEIMHQDDGIDALEHDIDGACIRMIALRQPVARDLRAIVVAFKISSHLKRIGEYGRNIARRSQEIPHGLPLPMLRSLRRMSEKAIQMIHHVLIAYADSDLDLALKIWHQDQDLDAMHDSYLREVLTYMMEDPRHVGACIHLMFVAKNMERLGDHAKNISENIFYLMKGMSLQESMRT